MSRIHDAGRAADHMADLYFHFAYRKRSKTGDVEGLERRLVGLQLYLWFEIITNYIITGNCHMLIT